MSSADIAIAETIRISQPRSIKGICHLTAINSYAPFGGGLIRDLDNSCGCNSNVG